jgi:hypothetical protein
MLPEESLSCVKSAFVKALVVNEEQMIQKVIWEKEFQQEDHITNNQAIALRSSTETDIAEDFKLHGLSLTDILISMSISAFYERTRPSQLQKRTAEIHIARSYQFLKVLAQLSSEPNGIRNLLSTLMSAVYCLCRANLGGDLKTIQRVLAAAEKWKSENPDEDFPPCDE